MKIKNLGPVCVLMIMALVFICGFTWAGTPSQSRYGIRFSDEGADHSTPPSGSGELYVNSDTLYFITDGGVKTNLLSGSATAWDDIANPDANDTITFSTYTATLTGAQTAADGFTIQNTGNFGDISILKVQQTTGNPTDGTVLEVISADTDADALLVTANSVNVLKVNGNGTLTLTGNTGLTGNFNLTGDMAVSGTSTLDAVILGGIITLDNGMTIDNASNNVMEWNENSEEIKWTFGSNVLGISSTSGVNELDLFDNAAFTLTHAADGGAEDFTISQTGSNDSSLVLTSAGTGADAISISTSAGGIDITVAGGAAGEDIDITTDTSINLKSTEGVASAVTITTDGAASETIVITNTQGTGDAAIDINATAGGVDIDAAKSVTIGSSENTADSIQIVSSAGGVDILASGAAAGEDIDITATGSSVHITATEAAADAITLNASTAAGGIDITSNADIDITTTGEAGEDITISNTGGSVNISASESVADAIVLDSSAGGVDILASGAAAGEDIDIVATGSSVNITSTEAAEDAIVLSASTAAGGIDITSNADIDITTTGEAGEDITISNTGGSVNISASESVADAIAINSSGGGVDITSAATFDIDLTATGGTVQVIASEAAANQFKVDAQGTIAGNAIVFETTDGGIQLNADGAENGDIDIDAADDLDIISGGDTTFAVTGTLSMGGAKVTNALMDSETVTAVNIITADEGNKIFFLGSETEFASTLPAVSGTAGMVIEFVITAAPVGADYTIITGNSLENVIIGGVVERETDTGDDGPYLAAADTVTFVASVAVVGDYVRFMSDGTTWYMIGQVNADGALTITQAD